MSDLIEKLSSLRSQFNCFDENERDAYHTLSEAIKVISERPEPCEDAVSRAEILRMINCINDHHAITPYKSVGAVTEHLTRIASNLPPVTPKQRTGKWILGDMCSVKGYWATCSACGHTSFGGGKFCRECGAKMGGSAE